MCIVYCEYKHFKAEYRSYLRYIELPSVYKSHSATGRHSNETNVVLQDVGTF